MIAEPNRNRRASDDLQDDQRDRQTRSASSSSERLVVFLLCLVFREREVQLDTTQPSSWLLHQDAKRLDQ
jgi:hypothetical protein